MAEQAAKEAKATESAAAAPRASKVSGGGGGGQNAGSELKVGQEVTLRAKVVDVTPGTGLNCVLQVLALGADGKPVEEASAPARFPASSAWCGKS